MATMVTVDLEKYQHFKESATIVVNGGTRRLTGGNYRTIPLRGRETDNEVGGASMKIVLMNADLNDDDDSDLQYEYHKELE